MFLFSNIFEVMATMVYWLMSLLDLYSYVLLARVIISWFNVDPYNPVVAFICRITDPLLSRVRRFVPTIGGMDFSPLGIFIAIAVVKTVVLKTIYQYLMLSSQKLVLKGIF